MPVRYQSVRPLTTHRYASLLTSCAGESAFTRLVLSGIAVDRIPPRACVVRVGTCIPKYAYYILMESHKKKLFNYPFFPLCGPDDTLYHSRVIRMSNAFRAQKI